MEPNSFISTDKNIYYFDITVMLRKIKVLTSVSIIELFNNFGSVFIHCLGKPFYNYKQFM